MKLPVIEQADFKFAIDSFQSLQQEVTARFAAEHNLKIDDLITILKDVSNFELFKDFYWASIDKIKNQLGESSQIIDALYRHVDWDDFGSTGAVVAMFVEILDGLTKLPGAKQGFVPKIPYPSVVLYHQGKIPKGDHTEFFEKNPVLLTYVHKLYESSARDVKRVVGLVSPKDGPIISSLLAWFYFATVVYVFISSLKSREDSYRLVEELSHDEFIEFKISNLKIFIPEIVKTVSLKNNVIIGRAGDCTVVIDSPSDRSDRVSSKHCIIFMKNDDLFISDLASTNGTRVEINDKFVKVPSGEEMPIPKFGVLLVAKEFLIKYRVVS